MRDPSVLRYSVIVKSTGWMGGSMRLDLRAKSPQALVEKLAEAINNGEMDAYLALHEPEATLVWPGGLPATGYHAIREKMAPLLALKSTAVIHETRVVQAAGVALIYCTAHFQASARGSAACERATHVALLVARRQPDHSWRLIIHDPHGKGGTA